VKIAVLSDTHVGQRIAAFPRNFLQELRPFDAIIHCGDYANIEAAELFQDLPGFSGVRGNMDDAEVQSFLPETINLEIGGLRIGAIHGWGNSDGLAHKIVSAIEDVYPDSKFNIMLFGHAHEPFKDAIGETLVLNPGAFSGNKDSSFGSWGILTIEDSHIEWELKMFDPKGL